MRRRGQGLSGFEKEDQLHWATYIRDWILTEYFQVGRSEENREELLTLFSRKDTRILLLLDGVNESLHTDRLAFEVSTLLEYPGVQVVLASRHANIPWDCLKTFHTVSLLPLDKELVNNRLEKAGLLYDGEGSVILLNSSDNPKMLKLAEALLNGEKISFED